MNTVAPAKSDIGSRSFAFFLIFASFFPYLSPIPLASDTQPIALLLGLLGLFFLISTEDRFPVQIWVLAIPFGASALMSLFSGIDFGAIRNASSYASLFVLSLAAYHVFRRINFDLAKYLPWIAGIWLSIGLVQVLYDKQFGTFFLGSVRTTELRGATSLAPEPTFFATALLFILFFSLSSARLNLRVATACALGILLVAQSAQITLIVLAGGLTFVLMRLVFLQIRGGILLVLVAMAVAVYSVVSALSSTRIVSVLRLVAENPAALFLVDASANNRASHIWISIKGLFDNFLFPHGVQGESWSTYFYEQVTARPDLFWFAFPGDQIMSGYGKGFFELGFLSFLIFFSINSCLSVRIWQSSALKWSMIVMVNLLLVSAIPLSHPLIPTFIAWLAADAARTRIVAT